DDVWIVEFGKLKPEVALKFGIDVVELKQDVWIADIDMESICQITQVKHKTYKQIPVFPSVERDISFLIKQDIPYTVIQTGLSDIGVKILKSFWLIDEYKGKQIPAGFRSLSLRFTFNNLQKTLTDEEVDVALTQIIDKMKSLWDIELR
ncbi:MAG: phenylalanine--tRNA ligase subunit beta, partial [Candidatus Cloacimonetes bacterium]|nr:phenylalanine--tRNA ligase subunit beta [Candidatus Cloacimonadota bacterium]